MQPQQQNPNLSDDQRRVLFEKGTEIPYSGELLYNEKTGVYACVNCGAPLFRSTDKYESRTPGLMGWPSFSDAIPGAIEMTDDNRLGMRRTETVCAKCHVHLGHYFEDPLAPNGKHYCINSVCLNFSPEKD